MMYFPGKLVVCNHLYDECVCIGDLVHRGHVLLHGLAGSPDSQQDEGVGEEDDGTGHNVAEEEEANDVGHGRRADVGRVPVDTAGRAVRL